MSTTEKIKKWVIAELGQASAVKAITGSPGPVWTSGDDFPSRTGVYIRADTATRAERFSDTSRFELWCVATVDEQQAFDLMTAVRVALDANAGFSKGWKASPGSLGLRLNSIRIEEEIPPDKMPNPDQKTYWLGVLRYEIKGKDAALPA